MKKTVISSIIAAAIMLLDSAQSLITVNADTTTNGEIGKDKGIVTTNEIATLYSLNNNKLTRVKNRALSNNSSWIYNKTTTGNDGLTYYRVATNEWVPTISLSKIVSNYGTIKTPSANKPSSTTDPSAIILINTSQMNKVVGNSDSKIYHTSNQRNFKIKSSNVVYFDNEQAAINAGYKHSKI
ncbi:sunset domain-containing protein [Companilactobacillus hulinensis]|uniref:sunset domain-containing protein n=1 Tax=Companilactobacillus hulinensis TaxID=2486007 RepID=UPI000F7AEAF2|nr:hypothetical protein [Companilactobacillus hulinensis]